jgi:hypothetical protein
MTTATWTPCHAFRKSASGELLPCCVHTKPVTDPEGADSTYYGCCWCGHGVLSPPEVVPPLPFPQAPTGGPRFNHGPMDVALYPVARPRR